MKAGAKTSAAAEAKNEAACQTPETDFARPGSTPADQLFCLRGNIGNRAIDRLLPGRPGASRPGQVPLAAGCLLSLQGAIGNRAVNRLLGAPGAGVLMLAPAEPKPEWVGGGAEGWHEAGPKGEVKNEPEGAVEVSARLKYDPCTKKFWDKLAGQTYSAKQMAAHAAEACREVPIVKDIIRRWEEVLKSPGRTAKEAEERFHATAARGEGKGRGYAIGAGAAGATEMLVNQMAPFKSVCRMRVSKLKNPFLAYEAWSHERTHLKKCQEILGRCPKGDKFCQAGAAETWNEAKNHVNSEIAAYRVSLATLEKDLAAYKGVVQGAKGKKCEGKPKR